ncbi:MAG: hypothetical protein M1831_006216 [Alyxoria varia]|nr:MAG: hypothetical protein M1831_006216 [Alyxoria varia]
MPSSRTTSPPAQPKSILINSNESGPQRAVRGKSRSDSRARLRSPSSDDESVTGRYIKHRDGRFEYFPDAAGGGGKSKRVRDLEHKDGVSDRKFRHKRDDYESDEGDTLKREKGAPPRNRGYADGSHDDDVRGPRPRSQPAHRRYPDDDPYDAPSRRSRYEDDYDRPRKAHTQQYDRMPVRTRARPDDYYDDRQTELRRSRSDRRYRDDPRDREYDRDGRRPKDKKKEADWKKKVMNEAGPLVMKEGGKLLSSYLEKQGR